ncbi:MAG: tRNA preQ1(34) S-adenosylmethionine ribosyltransferase-isomerase QueA [Candidatus Neomarinimicrobiota bacterium]
MEFDVIEKPPRLADFDLTVPEELVAQYPCAERDQCRLMVLDRRGESRSSHHFPELPEFLDEGDVLVLNDTRVFPARLFAIKERTASQVEVFLLRELEGQLWEVLVKPARKVRVGNRLVFPQDVVGQVIDNTVSGGRVIRFENHDEPFLDYLERNGQSPLPPYIHREPEAKDKRAYQTVYARKCGAVAAPTAGLHFTEALLQELTDRGVEMAFLTLHIGLGTFRPVRAEDITRHHMDAEYFSIDAQTAVSVNRTRAAGGRVVAVGTSTARALETAGCNGGDLTSSQGWTDKFIYPPYTFQAVSGLLTNFHQPKSTLIMLVSAFAGREFLFDSYAQAIREEYQFYSYGDAMLII